MYLACRQLHTHTHTHTHTQFGVPGVAHADILLSLPFLQFSSSPSAADHWDSGSITLTIRNKDPQKRNSILFPKKQQQQQHDDLNRLRPVSF